MDISAIPWGIVGDIGVAIFIAVLIFTGRLLPLGTVKQWLAMKDELIASERKINDLQSRSLAHQRDAVKTLTETNRRLVDEYGATTAYSLEQIQLQAKEAPDSDA